MINVIFGKKDNIVDQHNDENLQDAYQLYVSKKMCDQIMGGGSWHVHPLTDVYFSKISTGFVLHSENAPRDDGTLRHMVLKYAIHLNDPRNILIKCEKEKNNGKINTEWYTISFPMEELRNVRRPELDIYGEALIFATRLKKYELAKIIFIDSMSNNSWKDNFFTRITHTCSDLKNILFHHAPIREFVRKELLEQ